MKIIIYSTYSMYNGWRGQHNQSWAEMIPLSSVYTMSIYGNNMYWLPNNSHTRGSPPPLIQALVQIIIIKKLIPNSVWPQVQIAFLILIQGLIKDSDDIILY